MCLELCEKSYYKKSGWDLLGATSALRNSVVIVIINHKAEDE